MMRETLKPSSSPMSRRGAPGPRQAGFSLVEMMVAIVVSLILLAGVVQLLVSNKQAYRIQEGYSRLNEASRFARLDLSSKLRMGDHWGGVEADTISLHANLPAITNDCTQAGWDVYEAAGILGYEGAASSPMTDCIDDANYVAQSDIVVVRYADSGGVPNGSLEDDFVYLRTGVGRRAMLVPGEDIDDDLPDDLDTSNPPSEGFYNYPYQVFAFFVRPCSAPGPDGLCGTADDQDDGVPTLVRLSLVGTALVEEDVVEGVEQLQAVYGVNTDGDLEHTADRYVTADNVADWDDVVSVRLSLVVRNPETDVAAEDTTVYEMVGDHDYTPAAGERQFARRLFHQTIQVRNKSRG